LDAFATFYARWAMAEMPKPPVWAGYPGEYLVTCAPFIARQPWAQQLFNGYYNPVEREPVRGLKAIFADIANKYPHPNQPMMPRPLPAPVTCPRCETVGSLELFPASFGGQPIAIACGYRDDEGKPCGWRCQEDAQDYLAALAVLAQKVGFDNRVANVAK
jgi:hypothetical protein